ncbi:MAG: peptidyl-prolyl cis-trans isomerase [Gammaproteobacteria bacterium]|nr:peptidyl-prolyl cis-trans isomerase [Gammaproteobacteria bacterium]
MKRLKFLLAMFAVLAVPLSVSAAEPVAKSDNPRVRMTTSMGAIELELDARRSPVTVKNFLNYVERGFYNGTIFHRVIPGFMIQGGGFVPGMQQKTTGMAIKNEADNGLKNATGTIAMARTGDPHSATAQFFINTVDNAMLDHTEKTTRGWGYTVFGKVTNGLEVVKKIEAVATGVAGGHRDVPREDVVISNVELIKDASKP